LAAVVAATLVVGAAAQGLVGLGLGLVAAPVTALLEPRLMPDLLLWLAVVMPMLTLVREHHQIDWAGLAWAVPMRVPGTVVGVLFVSWFSAREMGIAVGTMVLASVLLTVSAVRLPVNRVSLLVAGFVSGIAGTATSIGGPPMALLYQHRSPRQIKSTLAVYFLFGAGLSLVGLGATDSLELSTFLLALLMVPFLLLGLLLSRLLTRLMPARHVRAGVLLVCAVSSLVLLAKSLLV
jgi:uncharacterized membrane protein YfcA